jgi:DNA-binding MltR family transcriptional regulator
MKFLDALNEESERGAVLISLSMLDDQLRQIIHAFLLDHPRTKPLLEGFNAPLGTLSARALVAFSLGLISEDEYADLDLLRKVRNEFAHNVHVSFENQRVRDVCKRLSHAAHDYGDVVVGPRGQFTSAAVALISNLTNRPHYVGLERLSSRPWRI